jgi:hypothetical protein
MDLSHLSQLKAGDGESTYMWLNLYAEIYGTCSKIQRNAPAMHSSMLPHAGNIVNVLNAPGKELMQTRSIDLNCSKCKATVEASEKQCLFKSIYAGNQNCLLHHHYHA